MARFKEIYIKSPHPFQRGVQHGSQVSAEIQRICQGYRHSFSQKGYRWEEAKAKAMESVPLLEQTLPDLMEEARGIAQGAGVPLPVVMLLNSRYELLKFSKGEAAKAAPEDAECTLYGVEPSASAEGETIVGQNWDNAPFIGEDLYVLHIDEENGTRILALTEPGQLVRSGMNSHGLGLACATLLSTLDRPEAAIPTNFLRRRLLQCRSMAEAQSILDEFRPKVSLNYLVGSAKDKKVLLRETNPLENYTIETARGVLGHGNDFLANPQIDRFRPEEGRQFRGQRLWYLLGKQTGAITPETMMEALRDHQGHPGSICNHCPKKGLKTIASTIYCLDRGSAYLCWGNPCENQYELYTI